jgi:hypothetical protein
MAVSDLRLDGDDGVSAQSAVPNMGTSNMHEKPVHVFVVAL